TLLSLSCVGTPRAPAVSTAVQVGDSIALTKMVTDYVAAARRRDLGELASFADDATFITTGGAYVRGEAKLSAFYNNLIGTTDSVGYDAGTPVVRLLDTRNALVYFTWRVNWYRSPPRQTQLNDIGMMSVTAQKRDGRWLWVAITSQRFPDF